MVGFGADLAVSGLSIYFVCDYACVNNPLRYAQVHGRIKRCFLVRYLKSTEPWFPE